MKAFNFIGDIGHFAESFWQKTGKTLSDVLIRYWLKDDKESTCDFGYIVHIIDVNGRTIVGIQPYEYGKEDDRFDSIEYYDLKDITISWYKGDENDEDEEKA